VRSIRHMQEKFKSFILNDQVFYGVIIIIVGIGSFGLGKASVSTITQTASVQMIEPVVINDLAQNQDIQKSHTEGEQSSQTTFIASKNGTKYHLKDCPGAKQIKPTNRIIFTSTQKAEAAGYTKAANCPKLQNL